MPGYRPSYSDNTFCLLAMHCPYPVGAGLFFFFQYYITSKRRRLYVGCTRKLLIRKVNGLKIQERKVNVQYIQMLGGFFLKREMREAVVCYQAAPE